VIAPVVPPELCGEVAAILARDLQRRGVFGRTPLVELTEELVRFARAGGELPPQETDAWLTPKEFAARTGIARRTVNDRCNSGRYPGARKERGRWLIPPEALNRP
jgi:hypothetical protein